MVLMGIVGGLGSGKTLSLTYLAYRNFLKGMKVYTNYWLGFPHHMITRVSQLEKMTEGFFAGDELWFWLDSRVSSSKRNRVVSKILISSRKRDIHFAYTVQNFRQVDVRIRNCTDFIAQPNLSPLENWCILEVFSRPSLMLVRRFKFRTDKFFKLYDTKEIVADVLD